MKRRLLARRPSPAMVVAVIALCVGVTGGAFAAATIGTGDIQNGAVTKKKVHKNAINSKKVKNKTLKANDFADGQLEQGVQGIQGLKGDKGEPGADGADGADGTARAYAHVDYTTCAAPPGACTPDLAKGVSAVQRAQNGRYCVTVDGISAADVAAIAAVEWFNTDSPEGLASAQIARADQSSTACPNDATDFLVVTERISTIFVDKDNNASSTSVADNTSAEANNISFSIIVP